MQVGEHLRELGTTKLNANRRCREILVEKAVAALGSVKRVESET